MLRREAQRRSEANDAAEVAVQRVLPGQADAAMELNGSLGDFRVACGTKASITRTAVSASRRRSRLRMSRGQHYRGSGVFDADPDVLEGHIIVSAARCFSAWLAPIGCPNCVRSLI